MSSRRPSDDLYPTAWVLEVLTMERPELVEQWESEAMLDVQLERLARNAANRLALYRSSSTPWVVAVRERESERTLALMTAVNFATVDDLDRYNTFDRDPDSEPLTETSLPSNWFVI